MSRLDGLRAWRRRFVKKHGKHAIRGLAGFFARQSRVGDPAVFDPARFAWSAGLRADWKLVRDEALRILTRLEELPGFAQLSPDQRKIAPEDGSWKTYFFHGIGLSDPDALASCPETARLLATIPGLETAFFSVLPPGAHIKPHCGITKGILRAHLGLVVPGADGCRMQLGDHELRWSEGELIVFDDTVLHEVWNDSDGYRVVLLMDFRRPMRWRGALVIALFLRALRLTGYVRDSVRNHAVWKRGWDAQAPG